MFRSPCFQSMESHLLSTLCEGWVFRGVLAERERERESDVPKHARACLYQRVSARPLTRASPGAGL
jgi:hypothetical protein